LLALWAAYGGVRDHSCTPLCFYRIGELRPISRRDHRQPGYRTEVVVWPGGSDAM